MVILLVSPLTTTVYFGRMAAEVIELPFGALDLLGPRNDVLDPKGRGKFCGKMRHCSVTFRENVAPVTRPLPKLLWDFLLIINTKF